MGDMRDGMGDTQPRSPWGVFGCRSHQRLSGYSRGAGARRAPPACQGSASRTAAAAGMQHYPQSMDHYVINKRKVVLQMRLSYRCARRRARSISRPSLTRMDRCRGQMGADSEPPPPRSPPGAPATRPLRPQPRAGVTHNKQGHVRCPTEAPGEQIRAAGGGRRGPALSSPPTPGTFLAAAAASQAPLAWFLVRPHISDKGVPMVKAGGGTSLQGVPPLSQTPPSAVVPR